LVDSVISYLAALLLLAKMIGFALQYLSKQSEMSPQIFGCQCKCQKWQNKGTP